MLDTKLFVKSTNPQQFLHFSSCHPAHTFPTIIKGELLRALRCTSDKSVYVEIAEHLLTKFMDRGYPKHLFMQVASTISFDQRSRLLQRKDREPLQQSTTIFCATHHPELPSSTISSIISDDQTPFDPMVVRKRPTSIKDMVVRTRVGGHLQHNPGKQPSNSSSSTATTSILPN